MDEKPAPVWRVIVGGLIYGSIVAIAVLFSHGLVAYALVLSSVASPFIGAWFIWSVVRRTNLRDDPRRAKLPTDAP